MKDMQQRIDEMIIHLGGYWRPLSGLARLLEEVGEVGGALYRERDDQLKEELLDVIVISSCLANQYAIRLRPLNEEHSTEPVSRLYFKLVEEAGEVGRILNAYEGDKKLKPNQDGHSLQSHIEAIQSTALAIGEKHRLSLLEALEPLIEEKSSRDFGRFDHTPDPITEASVRNYLRHQTGRYWGGVTVKPFEQIGRYIERERHLKRFIKIAQVEGLDGFVIQQRVDGLMIPPDLEAAFQLPEGFEVCVESYGTDTFLVIRRRSE